MRPTLTLLTLGLVLSQGALGCADVLGLAPLVGGAGGGASGGGGQGGEGAGGGEPTACEPLAPCYSGPPGTEGVGVCVAGTCSADGTSCDDVAPTVEDCASADDESCDGVGPCDGADRFVVVGTGDGPQQRIHLAVDPSGNVAIAGGFGGKVSIAGGPEHLNAAANELDVYVAVLDESGAHLASHAFGDAEAQYATGVAIAPGSDVLVVGDFAGTLNFGAGQLLTAGASQSAFVARFDGALGVRWARTLSAEGGIAFATGLVVDADGNTYVVGSNSGALQVGPPVGALEPSQGNSGFVVKLDPDGTPLWARSLAPTGVGVVWPLPAALGPDGGVLVAGQFDHEFEIGVGGPLMGKLGTDLDAWLLGFDALGNPTLLDEAFGGPGVDEPRAMAVGPDGTIHLLVRHDDQLLIGDGIGEAGAPASTLLRFAANGGVDGYVLLDGGGFQEGFGVAVDEAGHVLLSGYYGYELTTPCGDVASGVPAAFVTKLSPSDACVWQHEVVGTDEVGPAVVGVDARGRAVVAGTYTGDPTIPALPPANGFDLFVWGVRP